MSDSQLIAFFKLNEALFNNNSIAGSVIRWIGWGLFKWTVWIADKCEILYDIAYKMVDFTTWGNVNTYVDALKPLFVALMAVSIFALGIILIFSHEKKPKIIINICIAVLCVTCSTVVFQQLNGITQDLKEGFESIGTSSKSESVYDIVSSNLIDIVYLDQSIGMKNIDYNNRESFPNPKVNEDNINYIDYAEVMNDKSEYDWNPIGDAEDILTKKVLYVNKSGTFDKPVIRDVYNGFGWNSSGDADLANEFYYRYQFNFFTAFLAIAAVIILYVAMSYKCIRIAFELVVARLFAYLYSAELSGGQKIAKILCFIRDSYILLLTTVLCIRVFYLINAYIIKYIDNSFVQGIFILFAAFCVIDGPNLVEKLLGMDAGLKSSTARLMAAYGAAKTAMHTAMAPIRFGFNNISGRENSSSQNKEVQNGNAFSKSDSQNGQYMENKEKAGSAENDSNASMNSSNINGAAGEDSMNGRDINAGSFGMDNDSDAINKKMDKMDDGSSASGFAADINSQDLDSKMDRMDDGSSAPGFVADTNNQDMDSKMDDIQNNESVRGHMEPDNNKNPMAQMQGVKISGENGAGQKESSFMDERERRSQPGSFRRRESRFKSKLENGGDNETHNNRRR